MRDHRDEWSRQQHAQHGARAAEHQAFGQQRPAQRAVARAKCGTHGQFAFSPHRAGRDQVGYVRARNDEHDPCRGQQNEQDRPRGRGDLIAQPRHLQLDVGPVGIGFGVMRFIAACTAVSSARAASSEAPGASRPKSSVIRCVRLVVIVAPR